MARRIAKPTINKIPKSIAGLTEYAKRGNKTIEELLRTELVDEYGEGWTFAEVAEVYNTLILLGEGGL